MSQRVMRGLIQIGAIAAVASLLVFFALNAHSNLAKLGITSGFGFLFRSTGWDISFSIMEHSIDDPYWRVLVIGVQNTVFVGTLGIMFATIIGTVLGVVRTSSNLVLSATSSLYVEIFRSIPMTLQIIFWYAILTNLPGPRSAYILWDVVFLSNRGLMIPSIRLFDPIIFLAGAIIGMGWFMLRFHRSLFWVGYRARFIIGLLALVIVVSIAAESARGFRTPFFDFPRLKGFGFEGGVHLVPEFSALLFAITIAGAAFVAETVRGALLAVPKGQTEAAEALGMKPAILFLKIRFPLALRIVLPPLGNQFMMIMKATTIGIAIGFSDLFMIVAVSINQSGQTIELILILMAAFVAVNLTVSLLINALNRKIGLKGYAWKSEA